MTNINDLLDQWHAAKKSADYWTDQEATLRRQIFDQAFPKPEAGKGNKIKLDHGMALIGEYRINYKIDQPGLETAVQEDPELAAAVADVISYRPQVKDGAWKKLGGNSKTALAPYITETPGMPGLEIKPASKVRWS